MHVVDSIFEHVLFNFSQMTVIEPDWWWVNNSACDSLWSDGSTSSHGPMLTKYLRRQIASPDLNESKLFFVYSLRIQTIFFLDPSTVFLRLVDDICSSCTVIAYLLDSCYFTHNFLLLYVDSHSFLWICGLSSQGTETFQWHRNSVCKIWRWHVLVARLQSGH